MRAVRIGAIKLVGCLAAAQLAIRVIKMTAMVAVELAGVKLTAVKVAADFGTVKL